jgi:hypothetical protein
MALLTAQRPAITGVAATFAAASGGGDTLKPATNSVFIVKNGGGSPITVTVVVPGNTPYGLAQPDMTVSVAAGAEEWIGPLDSGLVDSSSGVISVTYSAVTSVTVAYMQHP